MKRMLVFTVLLLSMQYVFPRSTTPQSKADRLFNLQAYSEALEKYEKLLEHNREDYYVIKKIALCYNEMNKYDKALEFMSEYIENNTGTYNDYYQYANLLLIEGDFIKAHEQFKKCLELNPNDTKAQEQISRIKHFEELNRFHLVDSVINMAFNTKYAEMCPAFYKDSIAFVSSRDYLFEKRYKWDNQPFLDIYSISDEEDAGEIVKLAGINSKYHEGPLVFSKDNKTVWFTRNSKPQRTISGETTQLLGIYSATWTGKKWDNIVPFQHNSKKYSVGHPTFSLDGKTMYFASSMENGFGKTDLYKVEKIDSTDQYGNEVLAWSEPINLGPEFNTDGQEMFPFIDDRGVLFFSSDGFANFGGLDIYAAYPIGDNFNIINLGLPINSTYDDFGFIVTDEFTNGYFTSNRTGGIGSDDIYSFNISDQDFLIKVLSLENIPISNALISTNKDGKIINLGTTDLNGELIIPTDFQSDLYFSISHSEYLINTDSLKAFEIFKLKNHCKTIFLDKASQLQLLTINEENGDPLNGVDIILTFEDGNSIELLTDDAGKAKYSLQNTGGIIVSYIKDGFISNEEYIEIPEIGKLNYNTTSILSPIYEGKSFTLDNLYFDLNSSKIRKDAAVVLDELFRILTEIPTMRIELSTHTDCRADNDYNLILSQERAESVVSYLASKGIEKNRMIPIGYGETRLLNKCSDGTKCSEQEHQLNRRTEFLVIQY